MKEVHMGRATQAANQGAASTWRVVAKNGRPPIKIAIGLAAVACILAMNRAMLGATSNERSFWEVTA